MELSTYIRDLLYRYECVILPGFGAFLTQYRSAQIDSQNETFHPPSKVVGFNGQLQTNDGLLANYVAAVENCSYELALQRIRTQTRNWTQKLVAGETIELDRIGQFKLQPNDRIEFQPNDQENFNAASFGLYSFVSPTMDRSSQRVATVETPVASLHKSNTALPIFRYAAIGLLVLTLGSVGGLKVYEGQVEQHNLVERQKANDRIENQIETASFIVNDPLPALELNVPTQNGNYHVIAGAFRIEANASKKVNQLRAQGFKARHIGANRYGLHQVVYQSFQKRQDAIQMLGEVQQTENPDAWLLVQQLGQ